MKLSPQIQVNKFITYATVSDYVIDHIQKSYGDGGQYVTKSIKYMTSVDMNTEDPQQNVSKETDNNRKSTYQTENDIIYQEELIYNLNTKML